jgi:1-acyl-sn-glycerol-3-phosphate acyltransferase
MRRFLRIGRALRIGFVDPICRRLVAIGFRIEMHGTPPPRDVSCIWACNHSSHWEPVIALACARTPLHSLAMVELFCTPLRRFLLKLMLTIPVDRSRNDSTAAREAARRLRDGQQILVFPEGGIRIGANALPYRKEPLIPGAAYLAALSGAPILPVYITNGRHGYQLRTWFGQRVRTTVYFGEMLHPTPLPDENRKQTLDRINHELLESLRMLHRRMLADLLPAGSGSSLAQRQPAQSYRLQPEVDFPPGREPCQQQEEQHARADGHSEAYTSHP